MAAVLKPQTTNENISKMVDRFGWLTAELKAVDDLLKERDTLRKQLADYADSISDGEVKLSGSRYYVSFSKAPLMRTINNIAGFLDAVGLEDFLMAVKVSTTTADKLLSEIQKAALYEVSPGVRRLKDVGAIAGLMRGFYENLAGLHDRPAK